MTRRLLTTVHDGLRALLAGAVVAIAAIGHPNGSYGTLVIWARILVALALVAGAASVGWHGGRAYVDGSKARRRRRRRSRGTATGTMARRSPFDVPPPPFVMPDAMPTAQEPTMFKVRMAAAADSPAGWLLDDDPVPAGAALEEPEPEAEQLQAAEQVVAAAAQAYPDALADTVTIPAARGGYVDPYLAPMCGDAWPAYADTDDLHARRTPAAP